MAIRESRYIITENDNDGNAHVVEIRQGTAEDAHARALELAQKDVGKAYCAWQGVVEVTAEVKLKTDIYRRRSPSDESPAAGPTESASADAQFEALGKGLQP